MRQDSKICRICARSSQNVSTIPLFERSQKATLRRIFHLTGIKLKSLGTIPKVMCSDCEKELNRAYEFRERCLTAQMYFSSGEYKTSIVQRQKQIGGGGKNKTTEAESTVVKVEMMCENEYETAGNVVSEFIAFNERDIEIGESELLDQSMAFRVQTLAQGNKAKGESEIEIENPIEECNITDDAISIPVANVVKSEPVDIESKEVFNSKNMKTDSKKKLKKEPKNKESIFICDQCGNNFRYRNHFYAHIKRHTGIKPVQCEICPDKFFTQVELKRHMRRHTGERPFACQYCQRRFTDYSTRVKHERIHTNERPFECPQCDKAFTTSYVLKNHILVHTGERSFKCEPCNKSFPTQKNLIVHTRSLTHNQNVERDQKKVKQLESEETRKISTTNT